MLSVFRRDDHGGVVGPPCSNANAPLSVTMVAGGRGDWSWSRQGEDGLGRVGVILKANGPSLMR
jgi:hypothetical protein